MDPADGCVLIEQLTAAAHALLLGSDIALIEENTGRAFSRQKQSFRRLSKKARSSSTVEFRASGDAEEVGKELEDRLFDDQDVEEEEVRADSLAQGWHHRTQSIAYHSAIANSSYLYCMDLSSYHVVITCYRLARTTTDISTCTGAHCLQQSYCNTA